MSKCYLFGKMIDPELKQTINGLTYVEFGIYSNRECIKLTQYEKRQGGIVNGVQTMVDDERFKRVMEIADGSPVMVCVNPSYSERTKAVKYYLNDIYFVEPACAQAVNAILSRKTLSEVTK